MMKQNASAFSKKKLELDKREKLVKKRERLLVSIDRSIEKQKNRLADLLSRRATLEPRVKEMENILAQSEELKKELKDLARRESKAEKTIETARGKERQIKAFTLLLEKVGRETEGVKRNLDSLKKLEQMFLELSMKISYN